MESIRINFEVPKSPLYSSEYLTERAKQFVMGLIYNSTATLSVGEEREELARRWHQMQNDPTAVRTSQEVFDRLEMLV